MAGCVLFATGYMLPPSKRILSPSESPPLGGRRCSRRRAHRPHSHHHAHPRQRAAHHGRGEHASTAAASRHCQPALTGCCPLATASALALGQVSRRYRTAAQPRRLLDSGGSAKVGHAHRRGFVRRRERHVRARLARLLPGREHDALFGGLPTLHRRVGHLLTARHLRRVRGARERQADPHASAARRDLRTGALRDGLGALPRRHRALHA